LAAYVDGELNPRQREQADRLLSQSAEARELLDLLQRDSGELQALPRRKLPKDYSRQLAKKLTTKNNKPAPRPFPYWLGGAVAAAVLFGVALATLLIFSSRTSAPDPSEGERSGLRLTELDRDPALARELNDKLAEHVAPHLHLACQDPARAMEWVEVILKEVGIRMAAPAPVKESIRQVAKVRYVLFAEDVTPAELSTVLTRLAGEDRRAREAGGRSAGLGRLRVEPVSGEHRQELALLLGVDATEMQPGGSGRSKNVMIPMAAKKDGFAQPLKKAAAVKQGAAPERTALAVVRAEGAGNLATALEVRLFLMRRGPMRPGTVQVIVEFQPVQGEK
jgi:hypothetical protein